MKQKALQILSMKLAKKRSSVPTNVAANGKPLPAGLPRIEVIHELLEHDLTCACGCHKHAIGEEVSEQLEIVPMQIRVIKHFCKIYGCRDVRRATQGQEGVCG